MQPVAAVVFDLFDTLVDLALEELEPVRLGGELVSPTVPELHRVLAAHSDLPFETFVGAMRRVDRRFRETRYREGREVPTSERFAAVLADLGLADDGLVAALTEAHMGLLRAQVRAVPHHPELLGALAARLPLALCSNFTHAPTAIAILEEGGLRPHLSAEAISETVGFRKPRREIFEAALGALGVTPERVLHVGDNLDADVAGAAALGMRTAWLTRRVRDPEQARSRYRGPAPDHVIADLAELPELVAAG